MRKATEKVIRAIYRENEYLEAYSRHTELRVDADLKTAIGGKWEEIGQLQFDFLTNNGLKPHHRLLDHGCGNLRVGRHFIKYLNRGNYGDMDISPKAIAYANQLVEAVGIGEKNPVLLISEKKDLKFGEFRGEMFDYILAHSVFTHLKPGHIRECFENIGGVMGDNSTFYFTYHCSEEYTKIGLKDFRYPFSFFETLAKQYGFELWDCSIEFGHPRGQSMVELKKRKIL